MGNTEEAKKEDEHKTKRSDTSETILEVSVRDPTKQADYTYYEVVHPKYIICRKEKHLTAKNNTVIGNITTGKVVKCVQKVEDRLRIVKPFNGWISEKNRS